VDADVAVLERRPNTSLAEANLRPRARSLTYEAVAAKLIHGVLPTGRPALPKGIAVADPDRLLAAFADRGLNLQPEWDDGAWRRARDADVLRWADTLAERPGHLGTGSVESILDGLTDAGLGHLVDEVATRLEPLRRQLAPAVVARPVERPTLLFMHLPRSGGGAVCAALRELLPAGAYAEAREGESPELTSDALPAVIVGDFAYGFHRHVPGAARYVVMLRHPIGRILSLYRAAGMPGPSLESWVFDDRRRTADNAAVRAISGRPDVPFGACADDMLDEAMAHIAADFEVVLLRSSMPRSAVRLGQALGMTLPPFPVVNADPNGEDSFDPPKAVRKRLRELNRLDLALFKRFSEGF
jgi:hypothetical protein